MSQNFDRIERERKGIGIESEEKREEWQDKRTRVKSEENSGVLEGVLLLGERSLGLGGKTSSENGLNFIRVDDSSDIGVGDLGDGKAVIFRIVLAVNERRRRKARREEWRIQKRAKAMVFLCLENRFDRTYW
jgi:hypothetical protein